MYGAADEPESLATIHAAIDAGVNLLDTGDFYGMGHNEMLVGSALRFQREQVLLSVKFGAQRGPDGAWLGYDARPAAVKTALAYSLKRLGMDYIDIYRPARLDPKVPIEETVGAIAEMIKAGYVRYIGLSEVGPETIRRAAAVHPLWTCRLSIRLSAAGRRRRFFRCSMSWALASRLMECCRAGCSLPRSLPRPDDIRNRLPRFNGDNLVRNQQVVARLEQIADGKGITPVQLAVAWVLAKGGSIVPVMGARTRTQLHEVLGALEVKLTADEVAEIEAAVPADAVAGTRYDEQQMRVLDSEK